MKPRDYLALMILVSAGSLARAQEAKPEAEFSVKKGIKGGFVTCQGSFALRFKTGKAIYIRPIDPHHVYEKELEFYKVWHHVWWYKDEDVNATFYLGFDLHNPDCCWRNPVYFAYQDIYDHWWKWHLGCDKWHWLLPTDLPEGVPPKPQPGPPLKPNDQGASPLQGKATITVILPEGAKLMVNGEPEEAKSGRQVFISPGLEPGKAYSYTFEATVPRNGKLQSVMRRLTVQTGNEVEVNLGEAAALEASEPRAESPPAAATLTVVLPKDAQLTVNGEVMPATFPKQVFTAPDLEPGTAYLYTFNATFTREGRKVTATKEVRVHADDKILVDLTPPVTTAAAK